MPATGPLSHLDLSVGDPQRSIPFYATLLESLAGLAYGDGYYAAFFADPDGLKLEVVYHPPNNP